MTTDDKEEPGIYHRALSLCIEAYDADRTPASWRLGARLEPELRMARDAAGHYLAAPLAGGGWEFMGMPIEVLRDKPDAVLTLIATMPGGPEITLPPVIRQ